MYADGKTEAFWICVGIIVFSIWMHIVAVDDAKAENNRRDYWANSGPNGNHSNYTNTRRYTKVSCRRSVEETERRRLAEIRRSGIQYGKQ